METGGVLLPKSVNVSNFKYTQPKTLTNGSRTVYITHNSNKLSIQTPIMKLPYGVGEGYEAEKDKDKEKDDNKKPPSYDLHVSFGGHDDNPKMKSLLDLMIAIENQVKQDAFKNRLEWLDDDFDGIEQVVNKLFTPIVKYDKDKVTKKIVGKYPPTMKLKLPYDNKSSQFLFKAEDMDRNVIDFKSVIKNLRGGRGKFIIQLSALWFAGGKFGCTWKIINAKVEGNIQKTPDFIEESDDDNDETKKSIAGSDEDLVADALNNATITNDDADRVNASDSDDDAQPVPPPPAPKGKGKGKK